MYMYTSEIRAFGVWPQASAAKEWQENATAGTPSWACNVAKQFGPGKTKYLNPNLGMFDKNVASQLCAIRDALPDGMVQGTYEITDKYRCALVLLGGPTVHTRLHLDWSEARNVACGIVTGTVPTGPLAVWVLINPRAAQEVDAWIKEKGATELAEHMVGDCTMGLAGEVFLKEAAVQQLQQDLGADAVVVLEQHHGDVVTVPPGWVHQVSNRQTCLKIANDLYVKCNYGLYALLWRRIASPLFGKAMFPDYVGLNSVLAAEIVATVMLSGLV